MSNPVEESREINPWLNKGIQVVLILLLIGITFLPFLIASNFVALDDERMAFDWRIYYGTIWREPLGGFWLPPYAIPYFVPITALPFKLGWAFMLYITAITLILAVPRKLPLRMRIMAVLLLSISHPVIRNFADANAEAIVIMGLLLTDYAFSRKRPYLLVLAVLLAAMKPQEVSLYMITLGYYILREFKWRDTLKFGLAVLLEVSVTMILWGATWFYYLQQGKTAMALSQGLPAFGVPETAVIPIQVGIAILSLSLTLFGKRELSYIKTGFLVVSSLMITPYFNAISAVTVLVFAGIGLLIKRPLLGLLIFFIYNLPYLSAFGVDFAHPYDPRYWILVLVPTWLILGFELFKDEIQPKLKAKKTNEEES